MAEATLTYFDIRGRAELARIVLEYSGTKYTDKRVTFEEWPEVIVIEIMVPRIKCLYKCTKSFLSCS